MHSLAGSIFNSFNREKTNWSILGGIGWAYLSVCILFLLTRGKSWYLAVSFIVLVGMNVASKAGLIDFIRDIPTILWPFRNGSLASITMAGLLMSQIFLKGNLATGLSQKYLYGSLYALILFAAGWLLMPYGLAKIGSTPSYTL